MKVWFRNEPEQWARWFRLTLGCGCLCGVTVLVGAEDRLRFEPVPLPQGSRGTVVAVHQDSIGFLWIGTAEYGLLRYDGHSFITFRHDPTDAGSLAHDHLSAIVEDSKGRLWVGTRGGGVGRLDPGAASFVRYRHQPAGPRALGSDIVCALLVDREGKLWVGHTQGVTLVDLRSGEVEPLPQGWLASLAPAETSVSSLLEDRRGDVWIGTWSGGCVRLRRKSGTLVRYRYSPSDLSSLPDDHVASITQDKEGTIWVGTMGGGLARFQETAGGGHFRRFQHDPRDESSLGHNDIRALASDQRGRLWIGTFGGGANVLDPGRGVFARYVATPSVAGSLGNNNVRSLFEDRAGVLWLGVWGGGLVKCDPRRTRFPLFCNDPSRADSLSNNEVISVGEDRRGRLFVGTWGGGLNRFDRGTGRFSRFLPDPGAAPDLRNNAVTSLHEDRSGVMWVATALGSLRRFDERTGRFVAVGVDLGAAGRVFCEDRLGRLWIGTESSGLVRVDASRRHMVPFRHDAADAASLEADGVNDIYEDRAGTLWVATQNGLDRHDPSINGFVHVPSPAGAALDVAEDTDGTLWVLYEKGLFRRTSPSGSFSRLPLPGYEDEAWFGLHADQGGHLWLVSGKNVSRLDPATGTLRLFDTSDGLQEGEFLPWASAACRNGELVFGGTNGFNVIDPRDITDDHSTTPIVVTGLRVSGPHGGVRPLGPRATEILLPADGFPVTLELAALSYAEPDKNRFAYRLVGADSDWIHLGRRRSLSLGSLASGTHTLLLRGANHHGIWSEQPKAVRLVVRPRWTAAGVAVVAGLLAVLGTWLLLRRRSARRSLVPARVAGESLDAFCDRFGISERERDVVRLILQGRSNKEIEAELFISLNTVKNHIYHVFRKCGVKSRVQLVRLLSPVPPDDLPGDTQG